MYKLLLSASLLLFAVGSFAQSIPDTLPMPTIAGVMVYDSADVKPKAEYDMNRFLAEVIRYPDEAREDNIEGRVMVKIVINEDGSVSHPVILKSPHESLSEEVLRVIALMPAWTPGVKDGKPVKVYFTLPITFKLEGRTRRRKHKN
ncbi:MAG: energy transducer TonB [Taibaiella sp.]|nr:energy transducer TonB [Taibaiella sp.]